MISVHIPTNLFYPELPGGPNQYFRYGPFLRERGVHFHVHTARKPHHEEEEFEIHGIRVKRYETPDGLSIHDEMEYLAERALEEIGPKGAGNVLHPVGAMLQTPRTVKTLWQARLRGIAPCMHCMAMPILERTTPWGRARELARLRFIFSPYRKLLMCSRLMGRAYGDLIGGSRDRIRAIPNGIDLSVFSPVDAGEKTGLRRSLGLREDAPIVLYVGSVIPRKGVEILLEAWEIVSEKFPSARLVIVGSTGARPTIRDDDLVSESERYLVEILDQVEALRDPASVVFAGEVTNVRDYYRSADLFAFPSRREGLPSVVLESMACGVPCVVAPFVGVPDDGEEYGVAGRDYVRSSHDPARFAADLVGLLEDEDRRVTMGDRASRWIGETQEMGLATDQLAEVYREIAS